MSAISTPVRNLLRWDALAIAAGLLLVLLTFTTPLEALLHRWLRFDEAYAHGLFVFGATLFLIFRVLRTQHFILIPNAGGIILAGLTATAIALADVVNIQILQQMGAVFLWWAIVVALLGWLAGLHLALPIGFLYYAVPFWDYLTTPLVQAAVIANDFLLGLRGIHFDVDGVYIHLLDIGTFEIADGCSGLRYLIIALTLATLFSILNLSRVRDWIILHSAAIAMALLVNWVRIFVIILMGYETRMQSSLIHQHELFGWVLFAIALIPFFLLANRLMNRSPEPGLPARGRQTQTSRTTVLKGGVSLLAMVTLVMGPPTYLSAPPRAGDTTGITAPERLADWQRSPEAGFTPWEPQMRRTDAVIRETYRLPNDEQATAFNLGIWYYARQDQGSELVQYGNRLYDHRDWMARDLRRVQLQQGDWAIVILDHRQYRDTRVLAYSYHVAQRWTSRELMVKANMLRGAFTRDNSGALVVLETNCDRNDCAVEADQLERVLRTSDAIRSMELGFRGHR